MFGNTKDAKVDLRGFSDFCDSTSITNCAGPLNDFPPGQGLKSDGNVPGGCQRYSIPDGGHMRRPKGLADL
jgi:hypothetical protein